MYTLLRRKPSCWSITLSGNMKGKYMKSNYNRTMQACFLGFIVQAIVNNFLPLLFLTFQSSYDIPLSQITLLVTFNFGIQLLTDILAIGFIDKIGYRTSAVLAHILCMFGLVLLSFLPELLPTPFLGLLISVMVYAVGGGLLEVLMSPIAETCPTDNKEKAMSMLHSFYCWGHVGVVLISTLFFFTIGIQNWQILCLLWAVFPLINSFLFLKVPIALMKSEAGIKTTLKNLASNKLFWLFMLLMICAGASEQSVSQWSSTLVEKGFGISKSIGDLAGPMTFAITMGLSRVMYGKYGERIHLEKFMLSSSLLCVASYLAVSLSSNALIGLLGCAVTGFSVGIMWPGSFSMASASIKTGGVSMFALLALGGDVGCSLGPTVVGGVSSYFSDDLQKGILAAIVFPLLLFLGILLINRVQKTSREMIR